MTNHVVLGVTGSIAAYKAAEIVSTLKKNGAEVRVILTKNGARFITPDTMEALAKTPVVTDMFSRSTPYEVEHIALAKWADVFIVAPASANIIAKYAAGIADDMLSTTLLATRAKTVFAPAMNTAMYEHPATRHNIDVLRSRGVEFIEPESGLLACGDVGKGRMESPEVIVRRILEILKGCPRDFLGKTALVTAGATIEPIDPVRYITNRSTGKMGVAIADALAARGAHVILIAGNLQKEPYHGGIERVRITTAASMETAVKSRIGECDLFISAAAPADFTPEKFSDQKIKKAANDTLNITCRHTTDILRSVADDKGNRVHIGFAAETCDIKSHALEKLAAKRLNGIAANDVSFSSPDTGFGVDTNAVTLYTPDGGAEFSGNMPKYDLAHWLLDRVVKML